MLQARAERGNRRRRNKRARVGRCLQARAKGAGVIRRRRCNRLRQEAAGRRRKAAVKGAGKRELEGHNAARRHDREEPRRALRGPNRQLAAVRGKGAANAQEVRAAVPRRQVGAARAGQRDAGAEAAARRGRGRVERRFMHPRTLDASARKGEDGACAGAKEIAASGAHGQTLRARGAQQRRAREAEALAKALAARSVWRVDERGGRRQSPRGRGNESRARRNRRCRRCRRRSEERNGTAVRRAVCAVVDRGADGGQKAIT